MSDLMGRRYGMRGRIWVVFIGLALGGARLAAAVSVAFRVIDLRLVRQAWPGVHAHRTDSHRNQLLRRSDGKLLHYLHALPFMPVQRRCGRRLPPAVAGARGCQGAERGVRCARQASA
jgi:hypothetical protein